MTAQNKTAQQIQYLRASRGWTQGQLADRLGVSKQSVSNWETGTKSPRMGILQKMADLFEVSIGFITDGDGSDEIIDLKISSTVAELSQSRKRNVYSFVKRQLEEQNNESKLEFPEALAAHADDIDHEYTDKEIMHNHDFLKDAIKKYRGKNKE